MAARNTLVEVEHSTAGVDTFSFLVFLKILYQIRYTCAALGRRRYTLHPAVLARVAGADANVHQVTLREKKEI